MINDIKFALLHGIKNSFVIGITEATFGLDYKDQGVLLNINVFNIVPNSC